MSIYKELHVCKQHNIIHFLEVTQICSAAVFEAFIFNNNISAWILDNVIFFYKELSFILLDG